MKTPVEVYFEVQHIPFGIMRSRLSSSEAEEKIKVEKEGVNQARSALHC